jgi:hypothetical protein
LPSIGKIDIILVDSTKFVPIQGIAENKLVITVAPHKLICKIKDMLEKSRYDFKE